MGIDEQVTVGEGFLSGSWKKEQKKKEKKNWRNRFIKIARALCKRLFATFAKSTATAGDSWQQPILMKTRLVSTSCRGLMV